MDQKSLDIVFGIFMGLISVIGVLLKGKTDAYDKHLEECQKKDRIEGRDEEKLMILWEERIYTKATMHWLGDCMTTIAAKLDVKDLPRRPEIRS